jgi:hypothetical protein
MRISKQWVGILSTRLILIRYFIRYICKTALRGGWVCEWVGLDSKFAVDVIKTNYKQCITLI